jgi:hypothetical protein
VPEDGEGFSADWLLSLSSDESASCEESPEESVLTSAGSILGWSDDTTELDTCCCKEEVVTCEVAVVPVEKVVEVTAEDTSCCT